MRASSVALMAWSNCSIESAIDMPYSYCMRALAQCATRGAYTNNDLRRFSSIFYRASAKSFALCG